jgi:dTDP-4-amino-4,6-dideoxygalactose transaminase
MLNKKIFVTQPTLAPLSEVNEYFEQIWETGILTHNGPLVQKLELELSSKLGVKNLSLITNGTLAIQLAMKALKLKGEIITTPFSWVATISAIKWEGCTPVFCDIDSDTLNIDTSKVDALITKNTVAIMPVHVFGNPCEVDKIEKIAKKHNLKVIYDAAHAIGTSYKGDSVLKWGDVSAVSLHGTKIYNTAEGGACITPDITLLEKINRIKFFGHDNNKDIVEDGLNGKMTEVHAAVGLANLKYYDQVLVDRKEKYEYYLNKLSVNPDLQFQKIIDEGCNYSYLPVIFKNENTLIKIEQALNENDIYPRRYFYPALNTMENIVDYVNMPIAENISKRILALPLYLALEKIDIDKVCEIILREINI